jgi:DNA-binding GntR family transcriptional regulator
MPISPLVAEIARRILDMIEAGLLTAGARLKEDDLADRFQVSRSPVREVLQMLAQNRIVEREAHRGTFVAATSKTAIQTFRRLLGSDGSDDAYREIAAQRLDGRLADQITEAELGVRFGLRRTEVGRIVNRMAREGWIERRPGYGWSFVPVLTTPEAFELGYRFRAAIESAALLQPTFMIDREAFERCRAEQLAIAEGRLRRTDPVDVFRVGSRFHEMLAGCSGNPLFLDAVRRVNRMRRLLEYQAMVDTEQLMKRAREHLAILRRIETGDRAGAAELMRRHLERTVNTKLQRLRRGSARAAGDGRVTAAAGLHF